MARTEVSGSQIKDSSVALSAAASPTGASDVTGVLPAVNGGTGLAAPGASGNVLTSDGTNWTSAAGGGGGGGGGSARVTSTVTSAVTLGSAANTDYLVYIGSGGSVTLPTAVSNTSSFKLKNIDTTAKTIATQGDDPSFASVTALLHCDGENNSTVITDSSGKYTWTARAGVKLSTAVKKFGTASVAFGAGTATNSHIDAVGLPGMGTSDFTIEMWFYSTVASPANGYYLYDTRPYLVNGAYTTLFVGGSNEGVNAQKLCFYTASGFRIVSTTSITINTWHHVALSRSSGVTRLFLNGVQEGGNYTDTNNYLSSQACLGNTTAFINPTWAGYLDEIRVTQGVGRYTANFTAPTAEFPITQLIDGAYPLILAPNQAVEIASKGNEWSVVSDADVLPGFSTTPTSATITTLTVASNPIQEFTGSANHTVRLPTTGVVPGQQFTVINSSSGEMTVQSSSTAVITIMARETQAVFTALVATPTTAANWTRTLGTGLVVANQKRIFFNNSLTLNGTDGTTMTFPTTNATIARTDAAQTFTGVQTMTSPALTTATLTNPTIQGFIEATTTTSVSTAYTFVITASTQFLITLTANTTCTFTMPAASTTNSFTVQLRQPAATGNGAASFGGVRWPTNGVPTITTTAGRMDIINFLSDGTNWYGSYVQGYIY
jgi:hypothetical protein